MPYYVSRQRYYYSGENVVEIADDGLDYAGCDMLSGNFKGEGNYTDPREAVDGAIMVLRRWQEESPEDNPQLAYGHSLGIGLEFEPSELDEVLAWAQREWDGLPKCDHCGEVIEEKWILDDFEDMALCSEKCADAVYYNMMEGWEDEYEEGLGHDEV